MKQKKSKKKFNQKEYHYKSLKKIKVLKPKKEDRREENEESRA